jgi:hypothetical protein
MGWGDGGLGCGPMSLPQAQSAPSPLWEGWGGVGPRGTTKRLSTARHTGGPAIFFAPARPQLQIQPPFGIACRRRSSPPYPNGCGCSSGVEHDLAKVGVEGSNPFARSNFFKVSNRHGGQPPAAAVVAGAGSNLQEPSLPGFRGAPRSTREPFGPRDVVTRIAPTISEDQRYHPRALGSSARSPPGESHEWWTKALRGRRRGPIRIGSARS